MALSSEHRETWLLEIKAWREAVRSVDEQNWLVAVADHLTACEALLEEINRVIDWNDVPGCESYGAEIRALLGPAATEEGGT